MVGNTAVNNTDADNPHAEVMHYLQDHLGSPIRLTTANDTSDTYAMSYNEFGVPQHNTQNSPIQPFTFTGYMQDNISEIQYAQARYYDPTAGRFTAEDRFKGYLEQTQTLASYAYCINSPLNFVDLDGCELMPAPFAEGQEAHNALQELLTQLPGVRREHPIPGAGRNGGGGSADITVSWGNIIEVYEIKPNSWKGTGKYGFKYPQIESQLQRYIDGLRNMAVHDGKDIIKGLTLMPIINVLPPLPSELYPGKYIQYTMMPTMPGMIFWEYVTTKTQPSPAPIPNLVPSRGDEFRNYQNFREINTELVPNLLALGLGLGAAALYALAVAGMPFSAGTSTALKIPATALASMVMVDLGITTFDTNIACPDDDSHPCHPRPAHPGTRTGSGGTNNPYENNMAL